MFDFDNSTWEHLKAKEPSPQARAGHSATIYQDKMYIFGGKDEDNEKLKDFWSFDFETSTWEQLQCDEQSIAARSGHSCEVYGDYMIVFAGIHEITKELDDMAVYGFQKQKWIHLFKEPVPQKNTAAESSAVTKLSKKEAASPQRLGGASPTRNKMSLSIQKGQSAEMVQTMNKNAASANQNKAAKTQARKKSPKKNNEADKEEEDILTDPTSITL